VPCWPLSESLRSTSVQVGNTWFLKCSTEQLDRQNKIFAPILIITEAKYAHFSVCKRIGFVHQELKDFVKMTLTQVSSHWLWLESSHSVKNVTSVEFPFFSTWLEWSRSHQKSWLMWSWVIDPSHAITGVCNKTFLAFVKMTLTLESRIFHCVWIEPFDKNLTWASHHKIVS